MKDIQIPQSSLSIFSNPFGDSKPLSGIDLFRDLSQSPVMPMTYDGMTVLQLRTILNEKRKEVAEISEILRKKIDEEITDKITDADQYKLRKVFALRVVPKEKITIDRHILLEYFTEYMKKYDVEILRFLLINEYIYMKVNKNIVFPKLGGDMLQRFSFEQVNPHFVLRLKK